MAVLNYLVVFLLSFCGILDLVAGVYTGCHPEKEGMLNVHLILHTHTDPGWLVTADQYYYRQVQFILDGIVQELDKSPDRRFTYVEMSFFTRWWPEQDDKTKEKVRTLVDEGRLEFSMGGWDMNDEAGSHYAAIIDQHSLGFDFLRTTFGEAARTRVGWQIDPFGHSRQQASIFAQYGFDGMFFDRLDYQDKATRQANKTMEFVWHGSPDNMGSSSDLFAGILPNHYEYPDGFRFDVSTVYTAPDSTQFINDDPNLNDYNVDEMVDNYLKIMEDYHTSYRTNRVMSTMGSDYNYVDALFNFKEIDKLAKYVNERQANGSKVNVLYSTPSCYLKALNDDDVTWPTKSDDFFPYASRSHTYWTGYFTSRPALKYYIRRMNSFFQSVKQLSAFARLDSQADTDDIQKLAAAVAVNQHHDAVAGTEKQAVAFDYAQRLSRGQAAAEQVVFDAYSNLMDKGSGAPEQTFCHYANVSVCPTTSDSSSFEVTMYNPLSWSVTYEAQVPVSHQSYIVYAEDGETVVASDVIDAPQTPEAIRPEGMKPAPYSLYFRAELPPLGFVTYFVRAADNRRTPPSVAKGSKLTDVTTIEGKYIQLTFDTQGHVTSILNKESSLSAPLTQNFYYYLPFVGNNSTPELQSSGAYIFRPANNTPIKLEISSWDIRKGTVVQEVRQVYNDWINQTIRISNDQPYAEFEWTVGPIPTDGDVGKEIISRYNVDRWGNNGVFYTAANGREFMERKLNYRPTWQADVDEKVAGNYFPVDTHIHIKSSKGDVFTVMTDRSEGGTSLNDGDIELMLHRRLLHDDAFGVAEALNEPGLDGNGLIVRGSHFVTVDVQQDAAKRYRTSAQEIFLSPKLTFSNTQLDPKDYVKQFNTKWTGLAGDLPSQVHLLTLQKFKDGGPVTSPTGSVPYLVRFEHFYEVGEDEYLSQPVTFDIQHLFRELEFVDATELALGANIAAADVTRMSWKYKDAKKNSGKKEPPALEGTTVTLKPMQIVTLQVNYQA